MDGNEPNRHMSDKRDDQSVFPPQEPVSLSLFSLHTIIQTHTHTPLMSFASLRVLGHDGTAGSGQGTVSSLHRKYMNLNIICLHVCTSVCMEVWMSVVVKLSRSPRPPKPITPAANVMSRGKEGLRCRPIYFSDFLCVGVQGTGGGGGAVVAVIVVVVDLSLLCPNPPFHLFHHHHHHPLLNKYPLPPSKSPKSLLARSLPLSQHTNLLLLVPWKQSGI